MDDIYELVGSTKPDRPVTPDQYAGYKVWDVDCDGHAAQIELLNLADTTIKMFPGGERLSLLRGSISMRFFYEGTIHEIELNTPGQIIFLPGNVDVTFTTAPNTIALNEIPSQPSVNTHREAFPLFIFARYLEEGDHISGDMCIEPIVEPGPNGIGLYIYPVQNLVLDEGERVFLSIPGTAGKCMYTGPNPMIVDVFDGKGKVHFAKIEDGKETTLDLNVGGQIEIPSNVFYYYESTGQRPLVLSDTCIGFKQEYEAATPKYSVLGREM